ncbi:MAG: hypothetical protein EA378_08760 [Phycisphaerales bacterium]|nr:MAG: hypothetical protein EA378_08760 [Phycisphaerales bacterium]
MMPRTAPNAPARRRRPAALIAASVSAMAAAALLAPATCPLAPLSAQAAQVQQDNAGRETLVRLSAPLTIRFEEQRLEDVLRFIQEATQTEFVIYWGDDEPGGSGLDRDALISLNARNAPALAVLERVLSRTRDPFGFGGAGSATWQLSDWGEFTIGTRESLNRERRVEIYPILDLIVEIPDYPEAPALDLQSVLQAGQGGGGQSPFRDDQTDRQEFIPDAERAEAIIEIITRNVEPEQWEDAGGTAATIRYWRGNLLINAPDYVHRGINGYRWWPSQRTFSRNIDGRRYVSMARDVGLSVPKDLTNHPVSPIPPAAETTTPPRPE